MNRKKLLTTIAAICISGLFLYFAFKKIDLKILWGTLKNVDWLWAIPATIATWVSFWWRGWRWQKLLEPTRRCTIGSLLGPLFIGFGFNNIFPARAGEFARPLALKKTAGIPFPTGLSTVLLERLFDVFALLALLIFVLSSIQFDESLSLSFGTRATEQVQVEGAEQPAPRTITKKEFDGAIRGIQLAAVVMLLGSIAILTRPVRELAFWMVRKAPLLPQRIKDKITDLIEKFVSGFRSLHSPLLILQISLHTIAIWLLTALSIWLLSLGFPEFDLSIHASLAFLAITCVIIALPAAPGYWGLYEVGGQIALVLTGVVLNNEHGLTVALGFTLSIHFIHWGVTTALGLYYAARIHLSASELSHSAELPR